MLPCFTYLLVCRSSRICCLVLLTYWYVGVLEFVTQFYLSTIIARKITELTIFHKRRICLCLMQIFSGSIYRSSRMCYSVLLTYWYIRLLEFVTQFYLPTGM